MSMMKSRRLKPRSDPATLTVVAKRPKRPAKSPVRILLADDHSIIRDGLRSLLSSDGLQVVAQATDGREAVRLAREHQPDLAILDIAMPILNGIDAAREIGSASPKTQAILLTVHSEDQYVMEAVRAGIRGYVLKTQVTEDLMRAIREVAGGALYLSPSVSETVLRALRAKSHASAEARGAAPDRRREDHEAGGAAARCQREDGRRAPHPADVEARHPRNREPGALRDPPRPHRGLGFRAAAAAVWIEAGFMATLEPRLATPR